MSDAIGAQLHPDNLVVIRETADPEEYRPSHAGRFRSAAGIPDDVPLAGAAGRVDTWKGYDVLLDAFEIAKQADPRLHLVVAGGAVAGKEWLFDALEARAAAMPDVRWLGARTDIARRPRRPRRFRPPLHRTRALRPRRGGGAGVRRAGHRHRRRRAT